MKTIIILCSLLSATLWADPSYPHPVVEIRYGVASDKSIEVNIGGDVAKPGKYFLPEGFGLKAVLGIAGGYGWAEQRTHYSDGTGQFRGRVVVHRKDESGKTRAITFEIPELQLAKTPDFELQKGDRIDFPHIRIWEK